MTEISDAQREWLTANRMPRRERWAYNENSRPFIDELVAAGLMAPAGGEFVMRPSQGETLQALGQTLPCETMISLYLLTSAGKACFAKAPQGGSST